LSYSEEHKAKSKKIKFHPLSNLTLLYLPRQLSPGHRPSHPLLRWKIEIYHFRSRLGSGPRLQTAIWKGLEVNHNYTRRCG